MQNTDIAHSEQPGPFRFVFSAVSSPPPFKRQHLPSRKDLQLEPNTQSHSAPSLALGLRAIIFIVS
jgi:hypothetical protein